MSSFPLGMSQQRDDFPSWDQVLLFAFTYINANYTNTNAIIPVSSRGAKRRGDIIRKG